MGSGRTGERGGRQHPADYLGDLRLEAALGRNGLPGGLQGLNDRDAANLLSSAMSLFDTIQALGGDEESGPEIGAQLDITV